MAATCRRMVWPREATDCSASLSGSARRTATSVMAEAIKRSSCARHTSSAKNQKMTIGHEDGDGGGERGGAGE